MVHKVPALPTVLFLNEDSLKMLRETFCVAQSTITDAQGTRAKEHRERLGRAIAEIDRQRPLGDDGKHGKLHTLLCGCERNKKSAV